MLSKRDRVLLGRAFFLGGSWRLDIILLMRYEESNTSRASPVQSVVSDSFHAPSLNSH